MSRDPAKARCGRCSRFEDDPETFERMLPGILILSSGQGDSRGDQGICTVHDRMVAPEMTCPDFDCAAEE